MYTRVRYKKSQNTICVSIIMIIQSIRGRIQSTRDREDSGELDG